MKNIYNIALYLVLCLSLTLNLFAGNRSGTVSALFLKLPLSSRSVAMGGAQVAVAQGVTAMGYNPAGMLSVKGTGFGASYTAWFADITHSYAGVASNIPDVGVFGASIIAMSTDDMIETTPQNPEGTGRTFRASDFAFSVAFARQVTEQFMVGINAKVIKSYLLNKEINTSSFAFDVGTLYDIPILRSRIGVSLTNIGKDLQYINETYSIPTALRFGVLIDLMKEDNESLVSTFQVARLNDAEEQYNLGAEYLISNLVALRGGWKFAYDQENFTTGFGVKLNSLGLDGMLDYGYNNFKFLPGTHSFTFEMQF